MTIGELETKTGMTRANIRYYEQEGLLSPVRRENGYRDYSQEDLDTLLRIKLLRQLDFSLEEIRKLQQGEADFPAAMARRGAELARQSAALANARQVCLDIGREVRSFQELQADGYLRQLSGVQPLVPAQQQDERPVHPWRRFFARALDVGLASLVVAFFQSVVLHNIPQDGIVAETGSQLLTWAVVLLVEPLCLHFWGTTPGKWIWGIQVERTGGGHLTWREAYYRTFFVFIDGEGLSLPVVSLIRNFVSYRKYTRGDDLYWEEGSVLRFRERGWVSPVGHIAARAGVLACAVLLGLNILLPPNRGDLTVAEFVENYNTYAEALGNSEFMLAADGTPVPENHDSYQVALFGSPAYPEFIYEEENGVLRAVSCTIIVEDQTEPFTLPAGAVQTAAQSFAAARPGTNVFNILSLASLIGEWDANSSHLLQWQDVSLTYAVDVEGYEPFWRDIGYFMPVTGLHNRLSITFRAEIQPA